MNSFVEKPPFDSYADLLHFNLVAIIRAGGDSIGGSPATAGLAPSKR